MSFNAIISALFLARYSTPYHLILECWPPGSLVRVHARARVYTALTQLGSGFTLAQSSTWSRLRLGILHIFVLGSSLGSYPDPARLWQVRSV